ncbi:HAD family hydrolase [Spirochaetia bacterium 38H-sp]|uniref:phosphoglycolate phosphatase n=1 Tax=Rarispira pelagica TaxID=3141764 RepID=A0ABU9UBV4_9SPIR
MKKIKAVVFDLDGTLINTLEDIALACNKVLSDNGYPEHPVQAYGKMVGDGAITLIERALPPSLRQESEIERLYALFRKEYADRAHRSTCLYPGIKELLEHLKKMGIPMAVLSNKPDFIVKDSVKPFLPLEYFDILLGHKDGEKPKPDPAGLKRIISAWELEKEPSCVCMVGDSDVDVFTAKAAGASSCGAAWGFRGREELEKAGADFVADSACELLEFFS